MTATPELFQETALKFRNSIHDLNEEIDEAVMLEGDPKFLHTRDDWDMKTLLIMLSECLIIMGVFMEAMGALVKLYGRRIRIASKHKAADATSVGSSLLVATASKVVSYPELPLTKATSPESNRQSPEAASPPPGPKWDRKPKPKFRSGLEHCIAKEYSQLSPPSESPAAEEEEGPPATAKRGRTKKQAADEEEGPPATAKRGRTKKQAADEEEGPPATAKRGRTKKQAAGEEEGRPVRRSTRHQTSRLNGEHKK